MGQVWKKRHEGAGGRCSLVCEVLGLGSYVSTFTLILPEQHEVLYIWIF